jgi:hypothetical protein
MISLRTGLASLLGLVLVGCIGMRTPLDDAAWPRDDAADMAVAACGSTYTIDTRPVPADILIVLDRSESMIWSLTSDSNCRAGATDCTTRAQAAVAAVGTVVTDNPEIRWGLELFPTSNMCGVVSRPQVGVSPSSASAIRAQLAGFSTDPSTPTASAIDVAVAYLKTVQDSSNKAILLVTDGMPNCGRGQDWDADAMADATQAATAGKVAGFPMYVIGIGPSTGNLNDLAKAGGTGRYFPTMSTSEIGSALRTIAKAATCTFKLNALPPDKDLVTVSIDQQPIGQDETNGWVYAPSDPTSSTIILTGTYCESISAGTTPEVQIVYGCPELTPPDAALP